MMENHKRFYWIVGMLLFFGLLLSACKGGSTQASTTRQPTPQPTSPPTAADIAKLALGQQLNINPAAISIVSVEPVEWPNTCLGVQAQGQTCAQVVVPGYLVMLEAERQRYEYHTNADGTELQAVPGPIPPLGGLSITWQADNACQAAVIDPQGVTYGPCGGAMKTAPLPSDGQKQDLNQFGTVYAPFYAETQAGDLNLSGRGDSQATSAEQRMLAEWARLTVEDAILGEAGAAREPAIAWHREGGIAGFCDDLTVDMAGAVQATSCKGNSAQEVGQTRLDVSQLVQVYRWIDTLKPFEVVQTEPAAADQMTVRLSFAGQGTQQATSSDQQAIEAFAAQLFAELASGSAPQISGDPDQVVSDFLTALQQDPSGKSSLVYLSQSLGAYVESGHSLTETLVVESMYRSFGIGAIYYDRGGMLATVETALNYASPIERSFVLVNESGAWHINTIIAYAVPPMATSPDFAVADRVILAYVEALQEKDPAAAWALLTLDDESKISEADIAAEVRSIQNIAATSIVLIEDLQEQLVYQANLWVTVEPGASGPWTAGDNVRWFEMVSTPEGWGIARVSSTAP
jgi:hypothetical protein